MRFHGVIPAVLTPFDEAGQVDLAALAAYVEWLIEHGVHGLFPCGTNGEGPAMSTVQRCLVAERVVKQAAGRVPVVVMTGAISTAETIELTLHAQAIGATGAAVVAPWYFAHDEAALEAHFSAVAEALPAFPLYLYDIPGNAKNAISPALASRLADRYPHISGVKDSSKSLEKLQAFLAALPGRSVIVGTEALVLEAVQAGAGGVVSALADCFPELMVALYEAARAGEWERAGVLQARANRLRAILKSGPSIHPYKLALTWRGLRFGGMRAPLRPCTPTEADALRAALIEEGFLG